MSESQISDLLHQWDNGNRKYVVEKLRGLDREELFTFMMFFQNKGLQGLTTLLQLALTDGEELEQSVFISAPTVTIKNPGPHTI